MNVKELAKFNYLINTHKEICFLKSLFLPYTKRVYIVGGFIRDFLLGIDNNDFDIEVHGLNQKQFDLLMTQIGAKGVGKSFFVYRYKNIDISLPRVESKIGIGHKGFKVKLAKDEYEATIRRDFTINALMVNIFNGEILDFHDGLADLKEKRLKIVNKDKFAEDSLRVLRGIRFCAKYNLKIEKNSLSIMKNIDISDLSVERIFEEIKKISNSLYLEKAFFYMLKTNIFYQLFKKDISFLEFIKIYKYLKTKKKYFCDENKELFFLYILKELLKIDLSDILISKRFRYILKEKPLKKYNDFELLRFALKKPIKNYLFCIENLYNSKRLNIFDKKLILDIDISGLIKGLNGKDIAKKIKKVENQMVEKILNEAKIL